MLVTVFLITSFVTFATDFTIYPYIQNPREDGITIIWFSKKKERGKLSFKQISSNQKKIVEYNIETSPVIAQDLQYSIVDLRSSLKLAKRSLPFKHIAKLSSLKSETKYRYTIIQGISSFKGVFKTSPGLNTNNPIKFALFADSETEPESKGKFAKWSNFYNNNVKRKYLIDQATGLSNNIDLLKKRNLDFLIIVGDLVESGGEQRDWDEFWKNFSSSSFEKSLAASVPIFPTLGNHEYFAGPVTKEFYTGYDGPYSEDALKKYFTYFDMPKTEDSDGRYYSTNYGPVCLIIIDSVNGGKQGTKFDTNYYIKGELDKGGGKAPAISPGSRQYKWLDRELLKAQKKCAFTFVSMHLCPYSSKKHGLPDDKQSGHPLRFLDKLFLERGVDAIFSGHDEIYERSTIKGHEIHEDGSRSSHSLHVYDIGIAGDNLKGSVPKNLSSFTEFIPDRDAQEVWRNGKLLSGGYHYGHLEVEVVKVKNNKWQAKLTPVYLLPKFDKVSKTYKGYERKTYDDVITLEN